MHARWRWNLLCTTLLGMAAMADDPAPAALGNFDTHADIGATAISGSASFDPDTGTYVITGGGANMWGAQDAFHFAWRRMEGDVMIAATVRVTLRLKLAHVSRSV